MPLPPDLEQIRQQLIVLASRKSARTLGWPRDWRPTQVINPNSGEVFTPVGAWEYIVELLQDGVDIETKILDAPEEGKTAYVIKVRHGERTLYIKLQLGSGKVIGRSFHYSEYDDVEWNSES